MTFTGKFVYIYIQIYRIFRSRYSKLACVGFEPTTTEFRLREPTFYSYSYFISLFSIHVSFRPLPSSVATFALSEVLHR